MTDYRRPDLDLWEETDDAEDARPSIVSERPSRSLVQPLVTGVEEPSLIQPRPPQGEEPERLTPEIGRTALVKRLIEQGALEEDLLPRDSAEALRDSDIAFLRVSGPGSARPPSRPGTPRLANIVTSDDASDEGDAAETISDSEADDVTDDGVPTVVKRPLALPPPPMPALKMPLPARDRDVTERISLDSPLPSSLAPTVHTLRPGERTPSAFPWWQVALAALALVCGGVGVSQVRHMSRRSDAVSVAASQRDNRPEARPAQPGPAESGGALPAVSPAIAPAAPAIAAPAPAPVAVTPAKPRPAVALPRPAVRKPAVVASAEQGGDDETELPAAVKNAPVPSKPEASQDLPSQPAREQVTAALNAVVPELQKCVGDRHGTADVTLTVRPAGLVSYAVVGGMYAGTPEGSCLARAVKAAKFPAFSDPILRVTYPFQL